MAIKSTADLAPWQKVYGFDKGMGAEETQYWHNHNQQRAAYQGAINQMPFVLGPQSMVNGFAPKSTEEMRGMMYPGAPAPGAAGSNTMTSGLDAQTSELLRQILELPNLSSLLEQLILRSGGGERAGGGFGGTGGSPGG